MLIIHHRLRDLTISSVVNQLRNDPLFRNSVYIMLSTSTMAAFGFCFWLLVAQFYNPSQVGIASTLISSMNFIIYLSQLGFNSTFLRLLPAANSDMRSEHITAGIVLVAASAVTAAVTYVVCARHFAEKLGFLAEHKFLALSFVVLTTGASINILADSVFIAYRSAGYNLTIDGILASAIQLLLPVALLSLGTFGIYAAQGLGAFVAMILSVVVLIARFEFRPILQIHWRLLFTHLRNAWGNYVGNLLNILPTVIVPTIVLSRLGSASAGYYYLAFAMASLLFAIAIAVSQSMLSEASYIGVSLRLLLFRSSGFMLAIMIPAAAIFTFAGPVVLKLFGDDYATGTATTLLIFGLTGPVVGAYILASTVLQIMHMTRLRIGTNVLYCLVICGLAYAYAPRGLPWVAASWLVGNGMTAVVIALGVWRHRRKGRFMTQTCRN